MKYFILCLCIAFSNHSAAQVNGELKYLHGYNYKDDVSDSMKLEASVNYKKSIDDFNFYGELSFVYDKNDDHGYGDDNIFTDINLKPLTFYHAELGISELHIQYSQDSYQLSIGKQLVSWGQADAIYLLNTVNPFDMRESLILDDEDKFVGLWMINSQFYIGDDELQILIIPDTNGHINSCNECTYSPDSYRYFPSDMNFDELEMLEYKTDHSIKNASYALQYSGTIEGLDYTFNAMRQLSHETSYRYYQRGNKLQAEGQRDFIHKLGGSLSFALNDYVFRMESIFYEGRNVATKSITLNNGLTDVSGVDYLIGVDYSGFEDSTLMFQFYQQIVFEKSQEIVIPKYSESFSFTYNKSWLNETINIRNFIIYNFDDEDVYNQFEATYNHFDGFFSVLRIDTFSGSNDVKGSFSQFRDKSRVLVGFKYNF